MANPLSVSLNLSNGQMIPVGQTTVIVATPVPFVAAPPPVPPDPNAIASVTFVVDGQAKAQLTSPPWQYVLDASQDTPGDDHDIEVDVVDNSGRTAQQVISVKSASQ